MADKIPYLSSPGSLTKALEKIQQAATPDRVTYDFVSTVIGIKGGAGRALPPFLKRAGLVKTDGTPSDLYNQFRNSGTTRMAAATAFRAAYKALFERNEYAYKLADDELKGLIVEITGKKPNDRVTQLTFGTLKAFKAFCDFEAKPRPHKGETPSGLIDKALPQDEETLHRSKLAGMRLSYTINLNLPATDDIKVFDAIFRSLKEHMLKE